MASSLDQAAATNLLKYMFAVGSPTAPTAPAKGQLMSTQGNATSNGTEVANSGGSTYAAQSVGFGTPAAGSVSNSGTVAYTNMPAITTVAIEIWDSAGTPARQSQGALTANKTTALGDTLSFAASAITQTLT